MIKNFVAIDFEIANGKDPCSIGIVEFENGMIINQYYTLINPMIDEFNPMAIRIHNIRKETVIDKRSFNEVWLDISHFFDNKIIIAHQASTDISVLKHSLERFSIKIPSFESICTLKLSRAFIDLDNYQLNTVANFFDITQLNYHNALEDALVCGKIFSRILDQVNDIDLIYKVGGYFINKNSSRKKNKDTVIKTSSNLKSSKRSFIIHENEVKSEKLINLKFVVTGLFKNFSREGIKISIKNNGGKVTGSISKKTSYIIAGENMGPSKKEKAEKLNIPVISEDDYLKMLE